MNHIIMAPGFVCLLASLTSARVAGADPWVQSDQFQLVPGLPASGGDIASDPTGSILYAFGSGSEFDQTTRSAAIRVSADQGVSWDTLCVYTDPAFRWAHYRGGAIGTSGQIIAVGELFRAADFQKVWIAHESLDSGLTWAAADTYTFGADGRATCGEVKIAPNGDVYAAGGGNSPALTAWVVRKRPAGSTSFATVDEVGTVQPSEARAIAFHPTAGVLVAGAVATQAGSEKWTVRRSPDGITWTSLDSFVDGNGTRSFAEAIATDAQGAIYVAGKAEQIVKGRRVTNWVVRRSTNGGGTWTTIDKHGALADGALIGATAIAVAPNGHVYVAGHNSGRWIARRGVAGSKGAFSWNVSDDFALGASGARANGIVALPAGIIATGRSAGENTSDVWVSRKLQ